MACESFDYSLKMKRMKMPLNVNFKKILNPVI